MEFRLTYKGPLLASQGDPSGVQPDRRRENKHRIRQAFHLQLKRLWEITPFLKNAERSGPGALLVEGPDAPKYDIATLAGKYDMYGFHFVPLPVGEMGLLCGLVLRPEAPGQLITQSGDIDNRLKTLFDSLRIPTPNEEYVKRTPGADEEPFFCLLADDRLITKVTVETDQLLDVSSIAPADLIHEASLVITVRLRPYDVGLHNLQFA